jgi:uncharacterized membrane protein YciS (DUF1049 family)
MRGWGSLIFAAVVAAIVVALVVGNGESITVNLLVVQWPTKVWGALVAAAALGGLVSALMLSLPVFRLKVQTRRQAKRIAELEQELHGLRTLPIANDAAGASSAPRI